MYPIKLIAVGKLRLEGSRPLEMHYRHLLKVYARLDVMEVPESKGSPVRALAEEAQRIQAALGTGTTSVLLDAEGTAHDSERFAQWLGTRMDRGERLAFVLGSSHGVDSAFKRTFADTLSLSPMTFPHDLSRILFLEQLYRAFTLWNGKAYHK